MHTNFWPIFTSVVSLTLLASFLVGLWKTRGLSFEAYAADPNRYGVLMTSVSLTGTIVGGGMFLVTGTIGYEAGVVGYIVATVYLIGMILMGIFAPAIRGTMNTLRCDTLIDCVQAAFSSRVAKTFSIVSAVVYVFLLAGQFLVLWHVANYLSTELGKPIIVWTLTALAILCAAAYPIVGGLRKDVQTDLLQVFLIVLGCLPIAWALISQESVSLANLPPDMFTGKAYGLTFVIGLIVFYTPSFLVRADFWQRVRAAKTDDDARFALYATACASFMFFVFFTTIGIMARVHNIGDAKYATFNLILRFITEPILLGLVLGAFFAAVLSTADTLINNSSLFLRHIFRSNGSVLVGSTTNTTRELVYTRWWALAASIIAALLAVGVSDIVDIFVGALALLLVFLPLVVGLLLPQHRDEPAAFYSLLTGSILFVFCFFTWNEKDAFAPAVIGSISLYYVIRWVRTSRSSRA